MGVLLDTSFLLDLLRSKPAAVTKARDLDKRDDTLILATPVLYEVATGFVYARSRSEEAALQSLASKYLIMPFDEASARRAAEIRAEFLRLGKAKPEVDVMIAGMASAAGHSLVSGDRDLHQIGKAFAMTVEGY